MGVTSEGRAHIIYFDDSSVDSLNAAVAEAGNDLAAILVSAFRHDRHAICKARGIHLVPRLINGRHEISSEDTSKFNMKKQSRCAPRVPPKVPNSVRMLTAADGISRWAGGGIPQSQCPLLNLRQRLET